MPESIPPEIVDIFLKYAITSRPAGQGARVNLCDLLCVNSAWRDIGLGHVWSDIVVDRAGLARFIAAPLTSNLRLVKSFTFSSDRPDVRWVRDPKSDNVIDRPCRRVNQLNTHLYSLATILPRMSSLLTFSFYIKSQPASDSLLKQVEISRSALRELVDALPLSLENLEIDTKCYDRPVLNYDSRHVCSAIADRLSRLRHVRLRLAKLCPEFFQPSRSLESCVINLLWPHGKGLAFSCREILSEDTLRQRREGKELSARRRQDLVASLPHVTATSPTLRQFNVISGWTIYENAIGQIEVRDLLATRTTVYPLQRLDHSPHGDVFLLRRSDTSDVAGRMGDIEEPVEGNAWQTTTKGSRFPHGYKTSARGSSHEWIPVGDFATAETWP
ncbi:uncharacterized protein AB675_3621 [Cyphellophora attinorum]|uniref:Uncharacterized protein n=1 Tax=Cyphellophora attinorum TaxID=1664694 RepID=A0A0N1H0C5_9EURO|nr:uncharacterized protein AB675_3621 [Phialophora attinorum]KPI37126.1 hypothetical protein AB675_3621 [Phialophora attinorum]